MFPSKSLSRKRYHYGKKSTNIYKRKDGRWEGRYKNGYTASGKTRYYSVYGKGYSAVKESLEEKLAAVRNSYSAKSSYAFGKIAENRFAQFQAFILFAFDKSVRGYSDGIGSDGTLDSFYNAK